MSEKPVHQHPRILASFLNLTGAEKSYSLINQSLNRYSMKPTSNNWREPSEVELISSKSTQNTEPS